MRRSAFHKTTALAVACLSLACGESEPSETIAYVDIFGLESQLQVGGQLQLAALAFDIDGNELSGRAVSWSTSDPGKASISATGVLTALSSGDVSVTATIEGVAGTEDLTITAAPVESIDVTPSTVSLGEFTSQQLTVTLLDAHGNPTVAEVQWSSTNLSVARVDGAGLVAGIAPGEATIAATANGKSDIALVTVVPYPVESVELSPAGETIGVGLSEQFNVVLRDSVGAVLTGRPVAWSSTDLGIATVNSAGRVDGVAQGNVRIIAGANEAADTADVEVVVVPVASVTIVGETFDLVPADRIVYGVVARDAEGNVFRLESLGPVMWATSNAAVIDFEGGLWPNRAIAGSVGDATLTATVAGTSGSAPVTVRMPLFESLSVGGARDLVGFGLSCGRTASGATYCWGGIGDTFILASGVTTTPPRGVLEDPAFASVSAGTAHQCGVTAAGEAYCWGVGVDGRLGIGSTPERTDTPTLVAGGLSFRSVSAGATHSCGITTTGAAYCWGLNTYGQLGNGTIIASAVPVPVSNGLQFAGISAGFVHTCGVTTDGDAYCWGHNESGEVGSGTTTHAATPVAVAGGHVFREVHAGGARHELDRTLDGFSCGITTSDTAYCWGSNANAELGAGLSEAVSLTPVAVLGDMRFRSLSTGARHACGVATNGTAYCWGYRRNGQSGKGESASDLPGAVAGGLSWLMVEAGELVSCGIATSGATYCWGGLSGLIPHGSSEPRMIAGQP